MDTRLNPFILEGKIIHWLHQFQPKCILFATTQGEVIIKLSKDLRRHFLYQPQPLAGTWMQFAGEIKKNGEYKADYFDWLDRPAPEKVGSPLALPTALPMATSTNSRVLSSSPQVLLPQSPSISTPATNATKSPAKSSEVTKPPACILVCGKSSCQKRGAGAVIASLEEAVVDRDLASQVKIKTTGCLKKCKQGANVVFLPDKASYTSVRPIQVSSLLAKHFPLESQPSEQVS